MQPPDLVPQVAFLGAANPAANRQGKNQIRQQISKLNAARDASIIYEDRHTLPDPHWLKCRGHFLTSALRVPQRPTAWLG